MKDKILLNRRGGIETYLVKLKKVDGSESYTFKIKSEDPVTKIGYINDCTKYIVPPGGPRLILGEYCEKLKAKVIDIYYHKTLGYIITFKE